MLPLADKGAIDAGIHARGKIGREKIRKFDEDHLEGGSDELAPVGIVVAPHDGVRARGVRLFRGPAKGPVPGLALVEELFFEHCFKTLRRAFAVAAAIAKEKTKRVAAGLANHV